VRINQGASETPGVLAAARDQRRRSPQVVQPREHRLNPFWLRNDLFATDEEQLHVRVEIKT
jgi:hypothetical protein